MLADAILVQCVNPSLEGHPPSDPLVMKSMNKRGSENLKCEPDVNQFIKIEGVQGAKNGERVVAANTAVCSSFILSNYFIEIQLGKEGVRSNIF